MTRKAFTLIELLIVVAIIAILAAIAVPNFIEAQTRSKVSRVKADQRTIVTALESYYTDFNRYPFPMFPLRNPTAANTASYAYTEYVSELSSPIAFLSSTAILDPFAPNRSTVNVYPLPTGYQGSYQYVSYDGDWLVSRVGASVNPGKLRGYCISSYGPDRKPDGIEWFPFDFNVSGMTDAYHMARIYDPTNGTVSGGDVGRFGGEVAVSSLGGGNR